MARVIESDQYVEPAAVSVQANPLARIVYAIGSIIDVILVVRLVLRLLGANSLNSFVSFVYSLSEPLVRPFFGMFNSTISAQLSQAHFEVPTLVAIIVYGLIAWGLAMLLGALTPDRY